MTVTVSWTVESDNRRFSARFCPTSTFTFSRLTVVNPESSAVTRYVPTRSAGTR